MQLVTFARQTASTAPEAESEHFTMCFSKAFGKLPSNEKVMIFLCFFEGLGIDDVGPALSMKHTEVRTMIRRSVVKLSGEMDAEPLQESGPVTPLTDQVPTTEH